MKLWTTSRLHLLPLSFAIVLLVGCTQDSQVADLEKKVKELTEKTESLDTKQEIRDLLERVEKVAILKPGSDGFSPLKTNFGYVTVELADIAPYANGSKATLTFGNLSSATFVGLKATIDWGSVDEKGDPKIQSAKSRELESTQSLLPGVWTKIDVVLEGVPPTALGFVRVHDVSVQRIRLSGAIR